MRTHPDRVACRTRVSWSRGQRLSAVGVEDRSALSPSEAGEGTGAATRTPRRRLLSALLLSKGWGTTTRQIPQSTAGVRRKPSLHCSNVGFRGAE
jgi:hypothetical protein